MPPLLFYALVSIILATLTACDPMAPQLQPEVIVITEEPSATPTLAATETPAASPTPTASPTPDFTPTPTPFPCDEDGEILDLDFRSTVANETLPYAVYVPPCYRQQFRYPVLYLLHGLAERQTQWLDLGIVGALNQGIRQGTLPPMIVVMPYYSTIGTRNQFPPEPSYESVLLDELLPRIEADFCTWESREYRAIGGISRGGFWAYTLTLRYPDTFSIVGGHSSFFPDDFEEVPPAFSPLEIARNSTLLPDAGLRMYLDNAARDDAGINQKVFSDRLRAREIPHTYIIHPVGEHNNEYWAAHLSEYLTFYGEEWPRDYGALPNCAAPSP